MSGHSKWSTIKRQKGAADAKRGVLFTKLSKNISIAAKRGKDAAMNPALRVAIDTARAANMPKDNIERAVLRGAGELPGQTIEEITYEGYGPGGIAVLMHCATDNTNRTSNDIKALLNKYGGKLGGPGTVGYLFKQRGVLRVADTSDDMQLRAMDSGVEDVVVEDGGLTLYTTPANFETVKQALANTITFAEISLVPDTKINLADPTLQQQFETLLTQLEDNDDVVDVYHNANF